MTQELRDRLDDFFSHLDNDEAIAQAWQIVESLGDEEKLEALLRRGEDTAKEEK